MRRTLEINRLQQVTSELVEGSKLYDRRQDEISLDEIERIAI
jgi:hypothetical protein